MSEWQPIETAPKDGTEILLYYDDGSIVLEEDTFGTEWHAYKGPSDCLGVSSPTHWMPLPEPPN